MRPSTISRLECTDSQKPTQAIATKNTSITIRPLTALSITTATLSDATINNAYTATLAATGGVTPYTWTVDSGSLPAGLTLSAGGVISGTPTALGTSSFTVKVTDSQATPATATKALTLAVNNPTPLTITTTSLPNAFINNLYAATIHASGGVTPYVFTLINGTTLPPGLRMSASGVISGVTNTLGTTQFTVQVTDSEPTPQTATRHVEYYCPKYRSAGHYYNLCARRDNQRRLLRNPCGDGRRHAVHLDPGFRNAADWAFVEHGRSNFGNAHCVGNVQFHREGSRL